jgi:signal transduction histidine kinase
MARGLYTKRGGLEAVRSALFGLVVVGLLGIVGAIVSYRADVAEAKRGVHERVARQGTLYSDSLSLHLKVLEAELKRVAEHVQGTSEEPDPEVLRLAHHDRDLFGGGVALLGLDGKVIWSAPDDLLKSLPPITSQTWFQRMLAMDSEGVAIDALGTEHPQLVVAVRAKAAMPSMLIGVVDASDRFLFGELAPGEERVLLGANGAVLLPNKPPRWALAQSFPATLAQLLASKLGGDATVDGQDVFAFATRVRDTGLIVVQIESEALAIAPIRSRLIPQLVFLAVLQVTTLTLLSLYLRRIWRTFLEFEARVTEQEKMAALGSASSLIAHEVKNSLNGLNAAASLVVSGGDVQLSAKTLKGQIDRLGHLATSLLSFGKPSEARRSPLSLDQVAREAIEGLAVLPEFSEVKLDRALATTVEVLGDPLLLVTAIDNLVRNAIEAAVAAKDLGKITDPTVWLGVALVNGDGVLTVSDNAGGPPAGFEEHLYEPFFTTKAKGIGLGLSMARRAIEQQGGTLSFARTDMGSRFTLKLRTK